MAWVERGDLRTQKAKVYEDYEFPGRFRYDSKIHDLHYHDGSAWQDCDESIVDGTISGFVHKCDKVHHAIHMGSTGTRRWYPRRNVAEYVEFGRLQSWTGSAWQNVNLGTPTRAANSIVWDTTNFKLTLTNTWHRIKLEAVLKTEAARRRLRWAVSLNGLTWNAWTLVSVADSTIVGTIDKPLAWDANGDRDHPNVIITNTYSGGYVEFGGDLSQAVLPVTIDPTFTDGYGGDVTTACDTSEAEAAGDSVWGASTSIVVCGSAGNRQNGFLKFDVSSIPAGSTFDTVTLKLWTASAGRWGTTRFYNILSANSSWMEAGLTWNHRDGVNHWAGDAGGDHGTDAGCTVSGTDYNATELGNVSLGGGAADLEFDISLNAAACQTWLDTGNYGIVALNLTGQYQDYRSSDYATTGERPVLVVEYTVVVVTTLPLSAATLTAGAQAISLSVVVQVELEAVTLTASPQSVGATPGSVTGLLSSAALTALAQTTTVDATSRIMLGIVSLTASGQAVDIVPGAAIINLMAAAMVATGQVSSTISGQLQVFKINLTADIANMIGLTSDIKAQIDLEVDSV